MFGNIIYYDKKKIDDYKAVINGEKNLEISEYDISDEKGAQVGAKVLGADTKENRSYKAKIVESSLYECDEFDRMLTGRKDFFDFTQRQNCDLSTIGRGNIIKFEGFVVVPEEFDVIQTIEQLKPLILSSLSEKEDMNDTGKFAIEIFSNATNTRIPVLIDYDGNLLCSKPLTNCFLIPYEEIEEYSDLEVTVIARTLSNGVISKDKSFYDPLKDFMTLNRTLRKGFKNKRPQGLEEIFADDNYKLIETLAIYQ